MRRKNLKQIPSPITRGVTPPGSAGERRLFGRYNSVMPAWQDHFIYYFGRPYVLILAMAFVLTPSCCLVAALRSGAGLLNMGIGARPVSMGCAYTATADDINSIHWNPAGLSSLNAREIGATHAEWLLDTKYDFIGLGLPMKNAALGFGIVRLDHGSLQGRGLNRQSMGSFDAYDQVFSIAAGGRLNNGLQVGGGIKYLQSQIGGDKASSFAVDLGIIRKLRSLPVSLGLSLRNLGPGMKFISQRDPLPLSVTAGFACHVIPGFNLSMDVKRLVYEKVTNVSFGTEYSVFSNLTLRSGYLSSISDSGLGAGVGLNVLGTQFDYAVTPFGELGSAHRVSFTWRGW